MQEQFVTDGGTDSGLGQPATTPSKGFQGKPTQRRLVAPLLVAAAMLPAAVALGGPPAPAYTFKPVTFIGDRTPGGSTFNGDCDPSGINNRGEVAFTADYEVGGAEGEGVFIGGADTDLRQAIGFGQPAPGTDGGVFGPWEQWNLGFNDEGDVAILYTLHPYTHWWNYCNGFYAGVWRYSHVTQQLSPVVVPGDLIPGLGGATFDGVGPDVGLNNQGTIAFEGIWGVSPLVLGTDGQVNTMMAGLFLAGKDGAVRAAVLPGDPAPNHEVFESAFNPFINGAGDMSFGAWTGHAPVEEQRESVYIRKAATGEILTVARAGDPAPGGGEFSDCDQSKINDRGDVVFAGYLVNPDGSGLYLYTKGTLLRIAGSGDVMPGGGHFVSGSGNVCLNNSGTIAFPATLDTGEEGLYGYSKGSLRLIARTGAVIPGVGTVSGVAMMDTPINDRGQVAFFCDLTDGRSVLLLATPTGK